MVPDRGNYRVGMAQRSFTRATVSVGMGMTSTTLSTVAIFFSAAYPRAHHAVGVLVGNDGGAATQAELRHEVRFGAVELSYDHHHLVGDGAGFPGLGVGPPACDHVVDQRCQRVIRACPE
jgi:hypothetical protein